MTDSKNIHPVFDRILQRKDKESFLKQHSKVLWMTGLSGSGKSSIAIEVEKELHNRGYLAQILDGDNIRKGINSNLGFSETDRFENIRRISEVSKLFIHGGIITINCFVSPTRKIRNLAKEIIGEDNFIEVFIDTPLHVCEERDVKGLYKKARKGDIKDFTGINARYEAPESPNLKISAYNKSIKESAQEILSFLIPIIEYKA